MHPGRKKRAREGEHGTKTRSVERQKVQGRGWGGGGQKEIKETIIDRLTLNKAHPGRKRRAREGELGTDARANFKVGRGGVGPRPELNIFSSGLRGVLRG